MDAPLTDVAQIVQAEAERCRPLLSGKPVTLAVSGEHAGVLVRALLLFEHLGVNGGAIERLAEAIQRHREHDAAAEPHDRA